MEKWQECKEVKVMVFNQNACVFHCRDIHSLAARLSVLVIPPPGQIGDFNFTEHWLLQKHIFSVTYDNAKTQSAKILR